MRLWETLSLTCPVAAGMKLVLFVDGSGGCIGDRSAVSLDFVQALLWGALPW